ncbi:MAG: hypothetical protein E7031_09680 [Akkermansiaceae bacterium]|nr:hypothetical protein [Akkermansiaceae bacterium]
MLTDIFTPSDCAACKLCCNFHRSSAWETPCLEKELVYLLQEEGVALDQRTDGSTSFYLHFCTESDDEIANCPMLDTTSGCTLPRELRPFECRIWPLRLMRQSSRLVIGLYKNCPALKGDALQRLVDFATGELLPTLLDYAKRHPKSVREVNPAYDIIWQQ